MGWDRANMVVRCNDCRAIAQLSKVEERGACAECGSIEWKIAYKLSDKEVEQLKVEGFVFTEDQWSDNPNFTFEPSDDDTELRGAEQAQEGS